MKVEVAVLGSLSLIVHTVTMDTKQQLTWSSFGQKKKIPIWITCFIALFYNSMRLGVADKVCALPCGMFAVCAGEEGNEVLYGTSDGRVGMVQIGMSVTWQPQSACTHESKNTYICTCPLTVLHVHTHSHICTCACTHMHTRMHTQSLTCTHTHTHIYSHMHHLFSFSLV